MWRQAWLGICTALLLMLCRPALAWAPQRLGVDRGQLVQNLLPGQLPEGLKGLSTLEVLVEIDRDGRVVDARWPATNDGGTVRPETRDRDGLLAVARTLRFRPFQWQGNPVAAVGFLPLPYALLRGEKWAEAPHQPFPSIQEKTEIEISLARLPTCWGPCPAYGVRIDGQGNVFFDGGEITQNGFGSGVLVKGQFQTRISPAIVAALLDKFRRERFLDLRDEYDGQASDSPVTIISLRIGNIRKRVWETVGEEAGMPPAFRNLQRAIDEAADTGRWVKGNRHTVPFLRETGFDFSSPAVADVLRMALALRNEDLLLALTDQNLPWDMVVPNYLASGIIEEMQRPHLPLGRFLLTWAIRLNMDRLFGKLRSRGWLDRTSQTELLDAFRGAGGCHPVIDSGLRVAGIDLSQRNADLIYFYKDELLSPPPAADAAYLDCLKDALKADPDRADIQAFAQQSPALAGWLIANGHRIRLYDEQGQLGYIEKGQDGLLLTLLEAGVDPRGPDGTAQQLRKRGAQIPLPATLEWLGAHGIP